MGDPKFSRRSYETPPHPWKGERIKREDEYVRMFGLKSKTEFWKAESMLRAQRGQARHYLPMVLREDAQATLEAELLIKKLNRLGMLDEGAGLDDVLALNVESVLSRRLQTVAFRKGLASNPKQARQFIAHGHIAIGDRRVNVPGYLVPREEEPLVQYAPGSPLNNEAHPLRQVQTRREEAAQAAAEAEARAEQHRALKMAEEAEAEDKEDILAKVDEAAKAEETDEASPEPKGDEPKGDKPDKDEGSDEAAKPEEPAPDEPEGAAEDDEAAEPDADETPADGADAGDGAEPTEADSGAEDKEESS